MSPLPNSPAGPPWRMMSIPWALLPGLQEGARPNRAPRKQRCSLSGALQLSLNIPSQRTPQFPQQAPTERDTHLQSFLLHLLLKVPGKWDPSMFPWQGPYGERSCISIASGFLLHLYLSEFPIRSPPTKNRENIWSSSTEPHMDGRPTYSGVHPGSPRGSFMTLQSLP